MNSILVNLTKKVLKKYNPTVIGIVGDQEKKIIKESIFQVLSYKYPEKIRKSEENDSDEEFIIVSTILGIDLHTSTFVAIIKAIKLCIFKVNYPKYIVLDYPVNAPRKIDKFLKIVNPKIGVLGAITSRNIEYFGSIETEIHEKQKLVESIEKDGYIILNQDDPNVISSRRKAKAKVITFGFDQNALLSCSDFFIKKSEGSDSDSSMIEGVKFKLKYEGSTVPVFLPNALGANHVRASMVATSIGLMSGMNLVEVIESFKNFRNIKGKLSLIKGIKNTLIIDDTTDADPYSMKIALNTIGMIPLEDKAEKFVILGSMDNLGRYTESEHLEMGHHVSTIAPDYLYVIGEKARDILRGARENGMPEERCYYFPTVEDAGKFIQNRLESKDLILVSGGKNLFMEKIVKELMAEPLKAKELLVRH